MGKRSVTDVRLNIVSDTGHRSPGADLARKIARNEVTTIGFNKSRKIKLLVILGYFCS